MSLPNKEINTRIDVFLSFLRLHALLTDSPQSRNRVAKVTSNAYFIQTQLKREFRGYGTDEDDVLFISTISGQGARSSNY